MVAVNVIARSRSCATTSWRSCARRSAATGLPPQRLELEITESIFIDASLKAMRNLEALRQMGVRVALDDFGTGYSSLAYLRQFPFDTLKIDRAFVRARSARERDARAIVRSIVDLATALGMGIVAEGVEDPEQYELLRRAGCGGVQGYLIARPMVIDQVRRDARAAGRCTACRMRRPCPIPSSRRWEPDAAPPGPVREQA